MTTLTFETHFIHGQGNDYQIVPMLDTKKKNPHPVEQNEGIEDPSKTLEKHEILHIVSSLPDPSFCSQNTPKNLETIQNVNNLVLNEKETPYQICLNTMEKTLKIRARAVGIISQAWRRFKGSSLVPFFKKDMELIIEMPHRKFKKLTLFLKKQAARLKISASHQGFYSKFLSHLSANRVLISQSKFIPVMSSAGSIKDTTVLLPGYIMSNTDDQFSYCPDKGFIKENDSMKISSPITPTKEQLDEIVKALVEMDMFPWETSGCNYRAEMMSYILLSLGIKDVFFQYVCVPSSLRSPLHKWEFHVAPVVIIENIAYVIDPSLDPTKALTIPEWIRLQTNKTMNFEDMGTHHCEDFFAQIKDQKITTFHTPSHMKLENAYISDKCINMEFSMSRDEHSSIKSMQLLRKFRQKLEENWLNNLL